MEKVGLKLSIQKTKITVSSPISSWQIDGETVKIDRLYILYKEYKTDFILLASKITVDGDYSHKIKRHLLLGRKAMTNLDSILKSRDITLLTKVHVVKVIVFPAVMHGCERKLSAKEFMVLNCSVGKDSWESFGLQGDQTSQS